MQVTIPRRLRSYIPLASDDGELDGAHTGKRRPPFLRLTQRRGAYIILFVLFANLAFFYHTGRLQTYGRRRTLAAIWAHERSLPQHDLDLPPPEGRDGRFVRFRNQMWGVGFNNLLGEVLLLSHLAMRSRRAYVFTDFIDQGHARYPMNAFLSGPTAGAPWPAAVDGVPRAVSVNFWERACPASRRRVLDPEAVNAEIGVQFGKTPGDVFMDRWAKYLGNLSDSCVEIKDGSHQLFDIFFFGSPELLDLWPEMAKSPIMTHFAWSAPVQDAVARNMRLISPSSPATPWTGSAPDRYGGARGSHAGTITIQRLVAVHIRRGDFDEHCKKLQGWGAGFASWNLLKGLPDTFSSASATAEDYQRKCWPSIPQIVQRLHEVRAQHDKREGAGHELENVFIMTNGKRDWVTELMIALHDDGWRTVSSSKDLVLDPLEDNVNQAVDMEIARRAEVFVGNGYSTLSAMVTALRLTYEWLPENVRFL